MCWKVNRNAAARMLGEDIAAKFKKGGNTPELQKQREMLRRIEDIRDAFGRALIEAKKAKAVGRVSYMSAKENNNSSVKEQLKANLKTVNSMSSVANITYVPISKDHIREGIGYLNSEGEKGAMFAVPAVLKRGIIIDGHDNHKNRDYDTVTIAAPVTVNGSTNAMAVVVKGDTKNNHRRYQVHRILTPDGSELILDVSKNNAEFTLGELSSSNKRTPINSASDTSISHPDGSVKGKSGESFSFTEGSDYGTMPMTERESIMRDRALEMYDKLDLGEDIGMPKDMEDANEYIYGLTGWVRNEFGNLVVDHEAPVYLKERTAREQNAEKLAEQAAAQSGKDASENAALRVEKRIENERVA